MFFHNIDCKYYGWPLCCSILFPHTTKCGMDSDSGKEMRNPKRLKTLASNVPYGKGNTLLHQFVLDNSDPNVSGSENYINAVLLTISSSLLNVNALNEEGYTALHLAVLKNNVLMVKKLQSCLVKIDVNTKSGYFTGGNTALHLATKSSHLLVLQELLNKEANLADVNARNRVNRTPLHKSVDNSNLEAIKFLIGKGADVNARDMWDRTPLLEAVHHSNLFRILVKSVVESGSDLNARHENGNSILHYACNGDNYLDIIEMLLRNNSDVNAKNDFDETPLHFAAWSNHSDYIQLLLERGAFVNMADVDGWTPLHSAANYGHVEVLKTLLEKGADANARDKHGKTPLDLDEANNYLLCISALQNRS